MKSICNDLIRRIPIRARVAFVLAIAERLLPAISENPEALDTARKAIFDGWRWEEGECIHALQLYEDDVESLARQGSLVKDQEASEAFCAVTSAFFYMIWHAFRHDLTVGQVQEGDIPNDMAEMSEGVIDEVCDFAARTSFYDSRWVASLIERLSTDFHGVDSEDLGPVVLREYFR
jgi:hypothetical protein